MPSRLAESVLEIEQHVAEAGWDQPPRLFALVETAALLDREPALVERLGEEPLPGHLTGVEQEGVPADAPLEEFLAGIAWPAEVAGTALVVERVMLPAGAETHLPGSDADAMRWAAEHPERQEVRLTVGVLRDGSTECALRFRRHDRAEDVLTGPELVPGLAAALAATLAE